jgi:cytochrome c553/uncharacterized protein (DUF302 family)
MKKLVWLLPLLLIPWPSQAANLANGEQINRSCALCHGLYGQGTPNRLSPRLAGQDAKYLEKAIKDYRDGHRIAGTMVVTAGIDRMSDQDIVDVSAYLAQLPVPPYALVDVKTLQGDAVAGQKEFKECKNCHGTEGQGKPDKKVPKLAGQHTAYLYQSIKMFQWRKRKHGLEEDDQALLDEFKADEDIFNLLAHVASFDDKEYLAAQKAAERKVAIADRRAEMEQRRLEARARHETARTGGAPATSGKAGGLQISDIAQTVAQMEVKKGLKPDDAIQAMLSKAAELNMKLVGQQYVSKELEERGQKSPYLTILQFCDPDDARTMVVHNPIYASYMPCRIAMVEDKEGNLWLMMLSLDMLINSDLLPPEVVEIAIRVNQTMLEIMVAGATGEF